MINRKEITMTENQLITLILYLLTTELFINKPRRGRGFFSF